MASTLVQISDRASFRHEDCAAGELFCRSLRKSFAHTPQFKNSILTSYHVSVAFDPYFETGVYLGANIRWAGKLKQSSGSNG